MESLRGIMYNQQARIVFGLAVTIGVMYLVTDSLATLAVLLLFWLVLFRPWRLSEVLTFLIASLFFLGQNYTVLKTGGFSFRHKDILLMPFYEPFLWGFYYLSLKRFIAESSPLVRVGKRAIVGLLLTGGAFSLCAKNSHDLILASLLSTAILFVMFHEPYDFYYAGVALVIGFIIELFGVSTGLWVYPEPDFLGIPYWFATMWISVGLLGRRFLLPLAEWIGGKLLLQGQAV